MLRAALYARFSTDQQAASSIADQLRLCRQVAETMGASVVGEFDDAAISGEAMGNRPGLQAMMALAKARAVDVVIAEHTDRLSRSLADTPAIYLDLRAYGVRIHTVNQGEVGTLHVGMSATMSALLIEEIGKKTRRGLAGVVRSGRAAGGCPYGYEVVIAYDAKGERVRGLRQINEAEGAVVRRIFAAYANGDSPYTIVAGLNADGIPGPRGGPWQTSTVHGSAKLGLGVLRNELYCGVRLWGRNPMVKNRVTGKRAVTRGIGVEVVRESAPELRIVSEALWSAVQARLAAQSVSLGSQASGQRRPKALFGGLIRCSGCGGVMTRGGSGDHLRCNTRAQQGPDACWNTRTPSYGDIERRVLRGVEANLLHPAAIAEAVKAFNQTLAAERRTAGSDRSALERELADVGRRAERLTREVEEGMPWALVKDRHAQLTARSEEIRARLATMSADVIPLQPSGAVAYRKLFADLSADLAASDAGEAREAVRALIEEVKFFPGQARGVYELEVAADLSPLLAANETGLRLVRASNSRSRIHRSHEMIVRFRLAG